MKRMITLPRVMDEAMVCVDVDAITAIVANADENGLIEGTCAVYLRDGLAMAINVSPERLVDAVRQVGDVAITNLMHLAETAQ